MVVNPRRQVKIQLSDETIGIFQVTVNGSWGMVWFLQRELGISLPKAGSQTADRWLKTYIIPIVNDITWW